MCSGISIFLQDLTVLGVPPGLILSQKYLYSIDVFLGLAFGHATPEAGIEISTNWPELAAAGASWDRSWLLLTELSLLILIPVVVVAVVVATVTVRPVAIGTPSVA